MNSKSWLTKIEYQLGYSLMGGIVVAAGLGLYGDYKEVTAELLRFKWQVVPVVLFLTLCNYGLRTWRWRFYLSRLGVTIVWRDAWWIFLSGLAMSVTPGRVGELMKTYFLKKLYQVRMAVTAPLVLFERMTDGLGMITLMSGGLFMTRYGVPAIVICLLVAAGFIFLIYQKKWIEYVLHLLFSVTLIARYWQIVDDFYKSSHELVRWYPLLTGWGLSVVAWVCECLGFYLLLIGFGLAPSWQLFWLGTFIFGFAGIAGYVTLLPGGLGVAEVTMVGLLGLLLGVDASVASAITLMARLLTMWVGVLFGLLGIGMVQRLIRLKHT